MIMAGLCLFAVQVMFAIGAIGGSPAAAIEKRSRILFIASYNSSFHSFFKQIGGLKVGLAENGYPASQYAFDIEFMDSKRFPLAVREKQFHRELTFKLKKIPPYDVIVTADDNALNFARRRQDSLFRGSKIVFLGVNNRVLAKAQNANPNIVGVVEQRSLGDTLDLATRLFPNGGPLHVIHDDTPTGKINHRHLLRVVEKRPNLKVVYHSLGDLIYEQLFNRLDTLPASAPLFLNSGARDAVGQYLDPDEFMRRLRMVYAGPILTVQQNSIGRGALGGKVVSHFEQGRVAAGLVSKVLNGVDSGTLRVVLESPNVFTFDHDEMKRLGLRASLLPAESVVTGGPLSLIGKYKYWIAGATILFAIQAAFILLLVLNMRQRRLAEASLRESDARFRAFFENSPALMYVKDRNLAMSFVNAKYLSLFGVAAEDVVGQRGGKHLSDEKRQHVEALDRRVMAEEITVNDTMPMVSKTGEKRQFYLTKFPVYGARGDVVGIGGINTDVTELHEREQELLEAKGKAERAAAAADAANKSKSTFLATMSHEIRTPMNGVLGTADLLSRTELTEDQREFVDIMKESGQTLLDLLNDILDLSKIEAGGVELEDQNFSMGELLHATNNLWAPPADERGLGFKVENRITDVDKICSDRTRIRQIINNLVGNAIKFTSKGQVSVLATEHPRNDGTVQLRFEISDTGIGISPEHKATIFQPFTQADSSTTRNFGGTGLGLTICKNLSELLGGEIGVDSVSGKGSTFWFTIVAKRADLSKPGGDVSGTLASVPGDRTQRTLHILIAEDNKLNQRIISWMLEPLDCQFEVVENGLEAVAALARSTYDIVLMDVQMPHMDGIEAAINIRSVDGPNRDVPIIALTANAMRGDREKYLDKGMTDYVSKPIDQRSLLATIARHSHVPVPDFQESAVSDKLGTQQAQGTVSPDASAEIEDMMGDLDNLIDGTDG